MMKYIWMFQVNNIKLLIQMKLKNQLLQMIQEDLNNKNHHNLKKKKNNQIFLLKKMMMDLMLTQNKMLVQNLINLKILMNQKYNLMNKNFNLIKQ